MKSLLVLFVGLNAVLCALQNLANVREAQASVAYVISGAGQHTYPHTLFFYSGEPVLSWLALAFVIGGELAVGILGLKGAWDLFAARKGTSDEFRAAKRFAVWTGGLAVITWFGLFITIGAGFFQMWQTPMGTSSQDHAFQFAAMAAIITLFVCLTDD